MWKEVALPVLTLYPAICFKALESELEGILGGVGVGKNVQAVTLTSI
jgi:hypothetical protein